MSNNKIPYSVTLWRTILGTISFWLIGLCFAAWQMGFPLHDLTQAPLENGWLYLYIVFWIPFLIWWIISTFFVIVVTVCVVILVIAFLVYIFTGRRF